MPRDTSTGPVDTFRATLRRQFARLEGGHPDTDPVPNQHLVDLAWERTELTMAWAFAEDWNVELNLFHDVKSVRARYELPDGTPYDNPEGDLHHRTETLQGMADTRLVLNRWWHGLLFEEDSVHAGAGISIPTGRVEEDPYLRGDAGLEHQHLQFGTGTVDPLLRGGYTAPGHPWGFGASFSLQLPLYENRKTFRAPGLFELSAGPRLDFGGDLTVNVRYATLYQTGAEWDGRRDPSAGFFLQGISINTPLHLSRSVTFTPTVMRIFSIHTRGGDDTYEMDVMVAAALDVGFGGGANDP